MQSTRGSPAAVSSAAAHSSAVSRKVAGQSNPRARSARRGSRAAQSVLIRSICFGPRHDSRRPPLEVARNRGTSQQVGVDLDYAHRPGEICHQLGVSRPYIAWLADFSSRGRSVHPIDPATHLPPLLDVDPARSGVSHRRPTVRRSKSTDSIGRCTSRGIHDRRAARRCGLSDRAGA